MNSLLLLYSARYEPFFSSPATISLAISRSLYFWILPLDVLGYSSTQNTCFGTRCELSLSLTQAWLLVLLLFLRPVWSPVGPLSSATTVTPLCSTTKATTHSPNRSSGTPTTLTSATAGCWNKQFSISSGWMFPPPRMIRSLMRPVMATKPSSSMTASSPEYIHTLPARRAPAAAAPDHPSPSGSHTRASRVRASSPQYP